MMGFFQKLFGLEPAVNYKELIENEGAVVVDVRTTQEFNMAHAPNSINIPLNQVKHKLNKFKSFKKPIILVCASGNRSGQAKSILQSEGVTQLYNGGSWRKIK